MLREELPRATVRRHRFVYFVWIVPLVAALVAGYLVWDRMRQYGPEITVRFRDGGGLKVGQTPVRYRGVQVGEVTGLELSPDREFVLVRVRFQRSAASLAAEGSKFWVVRPQVGFGNVTGLGTVLTGPEINVIPGKGAAAREFTGLEHAPTALGTPGLRVVLKAERPKSLKPNSPVYYRGVEVGIVQDIELAPNAAAADVELLIWERFAPLVRTGSAFWNASGVSVRGGLMRGVEVDFESLRAFLTGGVEFASPEGSPRAKAGTTFFLHDNPRPEWLGWNAKIPIAREK